MTLVLVALTVLLVVWLIANLVFKGRDHSEFDVPAHTPTGTRSAPSPEHHAIIRMMVQGATQMPKLKRQERLSFMRKQMDQMGEAAQIDAEIIPISADGVPAEWVVAPGADPQRRVLYIHGGGFTMGSCKSHRPITYQFSKLTKSAVLAIDYRLMPEHPRSAGIEDCRTSYRFILGNGPHEQTAVDRLVIAGDSAGGNLALVTVAWARDEDLRKADAVVALSPTTDATLSSPSLQKNIETDTMLGPLLGPMAKLPRTLSLWISFASTKINPSVPAVSPLRGDLAGLPPTLVHASEAEMLLDDAVRYVNKARAAGSPAELQTWPFMLHVWHAFVPTLPEAKEAFSNISDFIEKHTNSTVDPSIAAR